MKKLTAILCLTAFLFTAFPFSADAADLSYKKVISAVYEDASVFSEGFAAVKKNGKWGYIDEAGKNLTEFKYDFCSVFAENKAIAGVLLSADAEKVGKGDWQFYIINTSGEEKPFMYGEEQYVAKGFTPPADLAFYGGIVKLGSDESPLYFTSDGNLFPYIPQFVPTEGKMIFWNDNDMSQGINVTDMEGNILFHMDGEPNRNGYQTLRIYPFNQGLALADLAKIDANGNIVEYGYGFINESGKFVIAPYYRDFYRSGTNSYRLFNDGGLASIMKNGLYGAIDKSGNERIPFAYEKLFTFQEGLAPFMQSGKWGVMDIYGNIVVEPKYDSITRFNDGMAIAYDGTKAVIIDSSGEEIESFSNIDLSAYVEKVEQADGSVTINSNPPSDMLIVKENGKYGYIKLNFTPAVPDEADADDWAVEEIGEALEAGLVPASLQNIYRENITREDFASLVCAFLEKAEGKDIAEIVLDKTGKTIDNYIDEYPFDDAFDRWIIGPYALGILKGDGTGSFLPCEYITRQDAAVMLERMAEIIGIEKVDTVLTALSDGQYIAPYAKSSVDFVRSVKVMNGTGGDRFSPLGYYTKQQAIATVYRLYEVYTRR